jgi:hypothetical protein
MKKIIIIALSIVLLVGLFFVFNRTNTTADDVREISVEQASLKEEPRNFSATLATLELYDKVQVLEELETWLYVVTLDEDEFEGYIQESVVSSEDVGTDTSEDLASGESSTAGARGFSKEIEDDYKEETEYDYDAVDTAEAMTDDYVENPEENFKDFREEGNLGEFQD